MYIVISKPKIVWKGQTVHLEVNGTAINKSGIYRHRINKNHKVCVLDSKTRELFLEHWIDWTMREIVTDTYKYLMQKNEPDSIITSRIESIRTALNLKD